MKQSQAKNKTEKTNTTKGNRGIKLGNSDKMELVSNHIA